MISKAITTALLLATKYLAVSAHINLGNGLQAAEEIILPGLDNITLTAPEGYTAAPLRWFGQAFPDGPNITIVGRDISHVHSKLRQLNPTFDQFNHEVLKTQQAAGLVRRSSNDDPQVADGFIKCTRAQFKLASYPRLRESIDYLRGLSGLCVVDGPKDSCNRCSCSWNAGVWMCNDSNRGVTHQFMLCTDMAHRGDQVADACNWNGVRILTPLGNGQFFHTGYEYSVLLAGDNC